MDHCRPVAQLIDSPEDTEKSQPPFEVRDYQLEAWTSLWDARQNGQKRGLICLATGLGKTSVAVFDVVKYRQECAAQDPPMIPRVLFVSHITDIGDQARERFEHFMPDAETDSFRTKQRDLPDADVTFATFQSLASELERFDPQDFEYIIYDEAHHSEASTFKKVRDYFDPLFELALTATPDRMDDKDIREYFGEALYTKTLSEAIAEGHLVDVDYHLVFDSMIKDILAEGFRPTSVKEFEELFAAKPTNQQIAANVLEEQHAIGLDDAKTIIFCEDVTQAEEMANLLGGEAYHSKVKKTERPEILKNFRSPGGHVICTVDMFNEGIDIPDARLLVNLRSTQSKRIFEQQLGRGLRKHPGKEHVTVLDFAGNIERIRLVQDLNKSIQERVTRLRQESGSEESASKRPSLVREHSDFVFEKMAVDLLAVYDTINIPAPEGTISIIKAARKLGLADRTFQPLAREILGELPRYTFTTHHGIEGLSTEQMEVLESHPEIVKRRKDSEILSVTKAVRLLRTSAPTLARIMQEMEIEPVPIKRQGRDAEGLTQDHIALLRTHPELEGEPMPDDMVSVKRASVELGISERRLNTIIDDLGWELPEYRVTKMARALSSDQMDTLRAMKLEKGKQGGDTRRQKYTLPATTD
jgi:superfamily II DNA or RNA helicase